MSVIFVMMRRFVVLRRDLGRSTWNIESVIHGPQTRRRRDMKILRHDQDYLEVALPTDVSWRSRAIGAGVFLGLALTYLAYRVLAQRTEFLAALFEPGFLGLAVFAQLLLVKSFGYETEMVRLDKRQNQFRIVQRNIVRQRVLQGNLREVQDVRITRSPNTDDPYRYQVALQIAGQPSIKLTAGYALVAQQLTEFEPFREFLGLPKLPPILE
jgi:hypothetical protein